MSIAKASKQESKQESKQASKQATEKASSSNSHTILMRHTPRQLFFKGNEKKMIFRCRFVFVPAAAKCVQV